MIIPKLAYEPSSFFHRAYPKTSRKSSTEPAVIPPTKSSKMPSFSYKVQGMFMPKIPANNVSTAIANDAIVNINWS